MDKDSTVSLHTGNSMPVMGLGTWQLKENTKDTISYALSLGYRLIDTSRDYGTQKEIGEAIKKSVIPRENFFIQTKVEEYDDAYEATHAALEELQLDYVDLMIIHRPPERGAGEELWEGLIRAKNEGLTHDIGVSNYSIVLIDKLIDATDEVPTVNQIEWNPFGYSKEMLQYCDENMIIIQAYSPLTRGQRLDDDRLLQLAEKYGKSPAQILIRWNLQLSTVPLPKANQKHHLDENIDVFDFELEDEDQRLLAGMNERYSALGSLPYH